MKKQWHIKTRLLFTFIGFTAVILLAVGTTFNLSVRGYIRSRVTSQLVHVSENASADRKKGESEPREKSNEKHNDRLFGASGSACVLKQDGTLAFAMQGNEEPVQELSGYFSEHGIDDSIHYRIISLENGKYAISVANDPILDGCYLVSYVDVTQILSFTTRINMVLLIIILAAIFISVFLSRQFAKSFAGPVQELSLFANAIGSGNLTAQNFQFRDVEFSGLAASMNQMVSELEASKQKQETLFQNVSHELRTPLTSIRGNAEGIVYGVMEPQAAARVILAESDKLGGMVEDILYLSRIGKAMPETDVRPIDLREVISLCVSEQRTDAHAMSGDANAGAMNLNDSGQRTDTQKKGITFRFDFDEEPVLLPIREQDAQRIFGNLISNAIRYAKSEVVMVCRMESGRVFASVKDDGEGIFPEDLPHIFERFYKGRGGKHGIGLAIAKAAVEMYRGTLTARNDGGAVFEVRF